jgi:hypothetical protein
MLRRAFSHICFIVLLFAVGARCIAQQIATSEGIPPQFSFLETNGLRVLHSPIVEFSQAMLLDDAEVKDDISGRRIITDLGKLNENYREEFLSTPFWSGSATQKYCDKRGQEATTHFEFYLNMENSSAKVLRKQKVPGKFVVDSKAQYLREAKMFAGDVMYASQFEMLSEDGLFPSLQISGERFKPALDAGDFLPSFYFTLMNMNPSDYCKFLIKIANRKGAAPIRVFAQGDIVEIRYAGTVATFDLSKGGNVVGYHIDSHGQTFADFREYERIGDGWYPKRIISIAVGDAMAEKDVRAQEIVFQNSTRPIDKSEFSIESLPLAKGAFELV